jgi:hypothetical protein
MSEPTKKHRTEWVVKKRSVRKTRVGHTGHFTPGAGMPVLLQGQAVQYLRVGWEAATPTERQAFLQEVTLSGSPPVAPLPMPAPLAQPFGVDSLMDDTQATPWREAFPQWDEAQRPGLALAGARYREGLTQAALAAATGIPQRHISEMERGKRTIGKERAKKLAAVLDVDYRIFL